MKLGILTQPLYDNYGGLLQNYALQQVLTQNGFEAETIDWTWPSLTFKEKLSRYKLGLFAKIWPHKYVAPRYVPSARELSEIRCNTNHFINSYIQHTSAIDSIDGFAKQSLCGSYDGYIVGSDQCWRPKYNKFMESMFLGFVKNKNVKRIAYAASFGTEEWEFSSDLTGKCAALAQKFDLITVREDSAVKLCKDNLGVEAIHVLDPTMLLTKEDYINLIESEEEPVSSGNLFNYILDPDIKKTAFINSVAKSLNLKPFQVMPKFLAKDRNRAIIKNHIEDCVFPGVAAWLRAFWDSEIIIVDSFHGMVFSILFNKPFWVIANQDRGMSRFTSLLKIVNLENRLIDVNELDKVDITQSVDWEAVNNIMRQQRERSINILLDALVSINKRQ